MHPIQFKELISPESPSLIVVTGGPGAGKTSLINAAKQRFCEHVTIVPEAATIVFSGGFWRGSTNVCRESAQRAIYHVQRQMEQMAMFSSKGVVSVCDRGTLDGLAYWPHERKTFFESFGTVEEKELGRYLAVIHLSVPDEAHGYNNYTNPIRNETASEAQDLDEKITDAWKNHPRRIEIRSRNSFEDKIQEALHALEELTPKCCAADPIVSFSKTLQMPPMGASIS